MDIRKLILELEMQAEREELRRQGLSEEEIAACFEFEFDFGSWYEDDDLQKPRGMD